MTLKCLFLMACLFIPCIGSLSSDINNCSSEIKSQMEFTGKSPVRFYYIGDDLQFLLPVTPIFEKIVLRLNDLGIRAELSSAPADTLQAVLSLALDRTPVATRVTVQKVIGSNTPLILSGRVRLNKSSRDNINYQVFITSINRDILFKSRTYTLGNNGDCPHELKSGIFNLLADPGERDRLFYRESTIKKFDQFFSGLGMPFIAPIAEYVFQQDREDLRADQIESVKDILCRKYRLSLGDDSPASITVSDNGSIEFIRNGKRASTPKMVEVMSLFSDSVPDPSEHYYKTDNNQACRANRYASSTEKTIYRTIAAIVDSAYPSWFNDFNYDTLSRRFAEKRHPTILTGTVRKNDALHSESVTYRWITKNEWLSRLNNWAVKKHYRYHIETKLYGIFQDKIYHERFWAIVRQEWTTKSMWGDSLYGDKGFLFIHFDFADDAGRVTLDDYQIDYRLWLYEYDFGIPERKLTRADRLKMDLEQYFGDISGINEQQKECMLRFLINSIHIAP